jgi:hypothetical protein
MTLNKLNKKTREEFEKIYSNVNIKEEWVIYWTKCSDRLPEKDGRYMVCVPYDPPWIGVSSFRKGKFDDDLATHWMSLPLSPE